MGYSDRDLTCADCSQSFTFTAGEQQFYADKGFNNSPTRCQPCRNARRAGGQNDRKPAGRKLHPAVCASCQCETQVPFMPSGDRPIYCRECFARQKIGH